MTPPPVSLFQLFVCRQIMVRLNNLSYHQAIWSCTLSHRDYGTFRTRHQIPGSRLSFPVAETAALRLNTL
jgi:hypothetical protein